MMYWFETLGSLEPFLPYHLRISIRRPYDGHTFYGFHVQDDKSLIKATFFRAGALCTPETVDWRTDAEEIDFVRGWLPGGARPRNGKCLSARACINTNTPNLHFVLSPPPKHFPGRRSRRVLRARLRIRQRARLDSSRDLNIVGATRHPIDLFSRTRAVDPIPQG
jgi:sarcosine oxidase